MEYTVNPGNINQIPKDACLAHEGTPVNAVFMVIKGHLLLGDGACSVSLGAGNFVGITDLVSGKYSATVTAAEESTVYAFAVPKQNAVLNILSAKKDYAGLAVWTLAKTVYDYDRLTFELINKTNGLATYIKEKYAEYATLTKNAGFNPAPMQLVAQLGDYKRKSVSNPELLDYYLTLVKQPLDKCKAFFNDYEAMAVRHIKEEAEVIAELRAICSESVKYLEEAAFLLMNKSKDNLYMHITELIGRQKSLGKDTAASESLLNSVKDTILGLAIFFEQHLYTRLELDMEAMEEAYIEALSGSYSETAESTAVQMDSEAISIIRKSLSKGAATLVGFACWEDERAAAFISCIEHFVALKNRMSTDDAVRTLKKEITKHFFDLYLDVFLKSLETEELPQIVDLFLNYAFVDDRLLTDEQLADICALSNDKPSAPCQGFTFREWLKKIYDLKRAPSKSEMDLDYEESLRERKKQGEISEAQMTQLINDPVQRVSYEVHQMFKSNARLANGQITTFVPIMYTEGLGGIPSKMRITKDRLNAIVALLTVNDPTVFYRELIYNNAEAKLERENIMKCVYPEFVLLPVNGPNIVMWQDTSSRKRDSAGRFIVPMFFEGNAEDAMLKALGRFRWELCKTIQSISWNNIQVKSLTSEYYDYIEYYRKNHDLSEEKKEKIKAQLTKARNNLREVFVQDYESWIKYEATGAVRMNKVAREIFATYIPFSKTVRNTLGSQPIFADAMARYDRMVKKKVYDLKLHYNNLEKNGSVITQELKNTLDFYENI